MAFSTSAARGPREKALTMASTGKRRTTWEPSTAPSWALPPTIDHVTRLIEDRRSTTSFQRPRSMSASRPEAGASARAGASGRCGAADSWLWRAGAAGRGSACAGTASRSGALSWVASRRRATCRSACAGAELDSGAAGLRADQSGPPPHAGTPWGAGAADDAGACGAGAEASARSCFLRARASRASRAPKRPEEASDDAEATSRGAPPPVMPTVP